MYLIQHVCKGHILEGINISSLSISSYSEIGKFIPVALSENPTWIPYFLKKCYATSFYNKVEFAIPVTYNSSYKEVKSFTPTLQQYTFDTLTFSRDVVYFKTVHIENKCYFYDTGGVFLDEEFKPIYLVECLPKFEEDTNNLVIEEKKLILGYKAFDRPFSNFTRNHLIPAAIQNNFIIEINNNVELVQSPIMPDSVNFQEEAREVIKNNYKKYLANGTRND